MTGTEIHEPKGVTSAVAGTVYVSNGAGSGAWSDVGTASFTGMIADFTTPIAPTGWLELDGSIISTTTYSTLYGVMAMQITGTRTNGSAIVTSIPSTTNIRAGYFVFGTGIATGTTVLTVDSAVQVTLSANCSSSTTGAFGVSPWLLNTGTIKLPDLTTAGRYRRSRTSATKVGDLLADQNQAHTHSLSVTGTSSSDGAHTHTVSITDPGHVHANSVTRFPGGGSGGVTGSSFSIITDQPTVSAVTGISAATASGGIHTHTMTSTGTSGSTGATEVRPLTIVVITCVKT